MSRQRPGTTGYERLAQADQFSEDSDDDDFLRQSSASLQPAAAPRFAPITQPGHHSGMHTPKPSSRPRFAQRVGSNGGVDLKAINARLERWADEIASRFKLGRGKHQLGDEERYEIHHSVFQPPEGVRPVTIEDMAETEPGAMTRAEFETIVESVRRAIHLEIHPSMISQGSSGSYFARDPDGKIVGVFKPKDEEPYAAGNPKWNKWIHRNLFPCFFGRACLIPNLSYVSEAAAYVLDCQLRTNLVPYTDVVWLSSKSFHYPFWDRRRFKKKKTPLPAKPGSFQVFLKGFKDANVFLRDHPWPDQYWSGFRANDSQKRRKKRKGWTDQCRPTGSPQLNDGNDSDDDDNGREASPSPGRFMWTETIKQSFREELEKLVILDYIMRNTDRGLDNWMIKVDWETESVTMVSEPMHLAMSPLAEEEGPRPVQLGQPANLAPKASNPYKSQKPMDASSPRPVGREPTISVGAIDNSLSWPWKHPDAWRSFPFGWLFLPVDLIGRPFSQKTRDHFLPLLTSTTWWSQTSVALKRVFQNDNDFKERMFAKQLAVMKGQAWNVVEALKTPDHGPLELTRRTKVCVWDDLVDVPVAVPMRMSMTSADRQRANSEIDPRLFATAPTTAAEDEADIAYSAPAHRAKADDLLGLSRSSVDMPNPGRFEITTPNGEEPTSPISETSGNGQGLGAKRSSLDRPPIGNTPGHVASFHGAGRAALNIYEPSRQQLPSHKGQEHRHQQRRYSFTPRSSVTIAQRLHGGDDLEGDLGYAAAEGQMGNQRKVIVERLETVKSKNPVFTWC